MLDTPSRWVQASARGGGGFTIGLIGSLMRSIEPNEAVSLRLGRLTGGYLFAAGPQSVAGCKRTARLAFRSDC